MSQSAFAKALLDPEAAIPSGITDPLGRPAPKRFAVYRNNVATGLGKALEAAFPAVNSLLGDEFFLAMALDFLRQHPPQSRIMMLYGAEFPAFIKGFAPAASLGYLPDVARLEQALRESYHAADAQGLSAASIAEIPQNRWPGLRLSLAPALRVVQSDWPVLSIWRAALKSGPPPQMQAEDVLVLRPEFDPVPQVLPQGGAAFIEALLDGLPVQDAVSRAGEGLDLSATLTQLMQGQAIVGALTQAP
jgi:hypothetical protein